MNQTHKNVDVSGAKEMIQQTDDLVILDVRTPEETAAGMIDNAIEIDIKNPEFPAKIEALDKEKPYLVYCRSGVRSVAACEAMHAAGFNQLTNMEGGYIAWTNQ